MRLVLAFTLLCAFAWSQPLVIKRVTVIDATGKAAQPDMTVVVEGDHIAAVSPWKKAKVPKNAQVVDGAGKFLIPGLWDMHAHGASDGRAAQSYPLYLANGVVGVRDMWGPSDANAWRTQHASSDKPSPSVYLGSPIVDGPIPMSPGSIAIANEAQGREVVAQQQQRGADFIKVYSLLPRDIYFAIADEARKRGIPFEGHVPLWVKAAEASDAGQKSIEHLTQVAYGCSGEALIAGTRAAGSPIGPNQNPRFLKELRAFETYDEAKAQALFARFVKNGTWQCPTLTVSRWVTRLNDAPSVDDARLKYVRKNARSFDPKTNVLFKDMTAEGWAASRSVFHENMKLVGRMHRAGVSILAGTDTFNPPPGFSLHDELALLVEAGLSPMAALQASTSNAARFMGQLDRRRTIEPGKIADLVLLDKDPLADIHNTRYIEAIVLNGKLMPRTALDAMLVEAETLANK
jgi:imidazolonepropionase-like amidohydrolase